MALRLRLADLLAGLSMVADMGYGLPVGEAMRSCLIGVALARRLNLSETEVADTYSRRFSCTSAVFLARRVSGGRTCNAFTAGAVLGGAV